jgi:excisionase family DNA binding protein
MDNTLMSAREVAEYLGIPLKTMYGMNSNGTAPPRIRVGRYVRYRRSDVELWLDGHSVTETKPCGS